MNDISIKYKIVIFSISMLFFFISIILLFFNYKTKKESYRIYYRSIDTTILSEMKNYDLNIVEASFFKKDAVKYLHNYNSKVIGYISLIEIGNWDKEILESLNEEDFLKDLNNNKLYSLDKINPLGDLSSSHFRKILIDRIEKRILSKEMDGVFLDTLDWIDYYKDNELLYNKLLKGYKEFIIELREKYPKIIIMQNRGFESYFKISKGYISSILWENFDFHDIIVEKNSNIDFKKLKFYAKIYKTNVYVISFKNEDINRNITKSLYWNYIFSPMEGRYSNWNIKLK